MSGSWGYRFSERLSGSLSLRYTTNNQAIKKAAKESNDRWETEGLSASLGYARPISWMKFSSYYRFFLRHDELRGDSYEHILELNSSTSKFRWGILYTMYTLRYSDETEKYRQRGSEYDDFFGEEAAENFSRRTAKTLSHTLLAGVRGRLPGTRMGRAYWNIEGEYYQSDTKGKKPVRTTIEDEEFGFGDSETREEHYQINVKQFSLTGDLSYPWRKGIVGIFRTNITTGTYNKRARTIYYYEGKLTYPISRRAGVMAWWRQTWTKMDDSPDREEQLFQLEADYGLGKTHLVFEGRIRKVTNDSERLDRIIRLKVRRTL